MAYDSDKLQAFTSAAGKTTLFMLSGTDNLATVRTAGYITDANDVGMKVGDLVLYADTATPLPAMLIVSAINADGSATLA